MRLLPQIRLQSQSAQTQLHIVQPQQSIQQPKAELSQQQPQADLDIRVTPSRLTINQTQAWEALNFKSVFRLAEEAADAGVQEALNGMARDAADGDELMRIENGGKAIASIAKRNGEEPEHDFNIGWIPPHGSVKIQFEPGRVDISSKINQPINNTKVNAPIIDYTPGKTTVSMKNHQSLSIDFEHLKFVGINYEQEI
ncbi:DUF6470 family protein [Bacillus sp. 2205SS5-2]|uniref:DUF6470 family protein n=1 Tax=Bacillus sp. 2205SS5-2 TaxID=3109031 RepID=UPI003006826F